MKPQTKRRPPHDPLLTQHEEQADANAAEDIEERHPDDRADTDRLVRRPHALVATTERLRNLQEVGHLGQAIAGHDQPQTIAALIERGKRAFVGEGVIDAAARSTFLTLLNEPVDVERNIPSRRGAGFGKPSRGRNRERGAWRVFFQLLDKSVRTAVRRKTNRRLVRFAVLEVADTPGVRRIEPVPHHAR